MLYNVERHTACHCYQKDDKQTIVLREFLHEKTNTVRLTGHHIIFIVKGIVHVSTQHEREGRTLNPGEFIFLPVGTELSYETFGDGAVLLVRLSGMIGKIPECHVFRFQNSNTEVSQDQGIYPLKANERVGHFLDGLMSTERDGLKCSAFARLEVSRLLFLLHAYYPQSEYVRFFATVNSPDVLFSNFVQEKWTDYRTVNEFADAMSMTTQQFTKRFHKVFGEAPGAWLQKRKAECIYQDICGSYKPLKAIALEYKFSMANFIRYCRVNFGSSPGAIREQLCASGSTACKVPVPPVMPSGRQAAHKQSVLPGVRPTDAG